MSRHAAVDGTFRHLRSYALGMQAAVNPSICVNARSKCRIWEAHVFTISVEHPVVLSRVVFPRSGGVLDVAQQPDYRLSQLTESRTEQRT